MGHKRSRINALRHRNYQLSFLLQLHSRTSFCLIQVVSFAIWLLGRTRSADSRGWVLVAAFVSAHGLRGEQISIIATEQTVAWGAFADAAALEKALRDQTVDVAAWNRDGAKGVAQLFTELENGESVLNVESGRVTRCLRVVKVRALPIICPSYLPCRSRATLLSTQSWLAPPCRPRMLA